MVVRVLFEKMIAMRLDVTTADINLSLCVRVVHGGWAGLEILTLESQPQASLAQYWR